MTKRQKKELKKIILSLVITVVSILWLKEIPTLYLSFLLCAYLIVGIDVLKKAGKNILRGKMLDENFLMSLATLGAILIGETAEALSVMLFYKVGELFQSYAVGKSRKSIASLMDIRPDYANLLKGNQELKVSPEEVKVGQIIRIKPGEKIPLDGIIVEGSSALDTKSLTGEAMPRYVFEKDEVMSGCINKEGILKVKVTKEYKESTVSKILDLVENASNRKSTSEAFITKFARYYTPTVVVFAILLAVLPPLLLKSANFSEWLYRSLSFLVVSCPCALVISIPLSFFASIGKSSRMGILLKGSNYLESLAKTEIIVCDKTGTLTEGKFKVQEVKTEKAEKDAVLRYAAMAESFSLHPIALSIMESYQKPIDSKKVTEVKEFAGKGVSAEIEDSHILVGNGKLMDLFNITYPKEKSKGTVIYVAKNKTWIGTIIIKDKIKEDAYQAISELRKNHIQKIVMLTGDQEEISQEVAEELKLDAYHASLLPQQKVEIVEKYNQELTKEGKLVFVGDGMNDAPVLALADIGISMGKTGVDAAIEASDVVIMTDEISKIVELMKLAKKTMTIVKENIIFAILIKVLVLILSACGFANMWMAVFADVGVSVLAILNAIRILWMNIQ